jgi:transcriptional antiterminator RfaH
MPVLPLEPYTYPEALLSEGPLQVVGDDQWWVLYCRPRAEKMLARRLVRWEQGFFLPLYEQRKRSGSRTVRSHLPLFPGYVFLWGDDGARVKALETNLVSQCLRVTEQEQLHQDLQRIHRMMAAGAPISPEDRMQPGDTVEIVSGPLRGLRGKLIKRAGTCKFLVEVDFLQRGASVEFPIEMVRPV